jgi:serine/threonine protein kinase
VETAVPLIYICPQCDVKTPEERCPTCDKPTIPAQAMQAKVAPDPFIGLTIAGKYLIEDKIGAGGMGSVYKARHKETDGTVAVKLIRTDRLEDENHIRRFYIEAQNTHQLHHPNTIRCSDFGQTDEGVLYLVMEYIDGLPLKTVLKAEKRLAPSRVVRIAEQILKSLGEAHAHQVVHRDIKPDNIMLLDQFGEKDFVKVLDFGVSRSLESSGASTQGAIGTPKYMSPEQWSGQSVDGRADLYALGGVMYHMIAGRLPFVTETKGTEQLMAFMNAHLKLDPIALHQLVPGACPESLGAFVMTLLAKNPDQRPANAGAALEALREIRSTAELADTTQPIASDLLATGLDGETMSMMPEHLISSTGAGENTGDSVAGRTDDTLGTQANDMPDGTDAGQKQKTNPMLFAVAAVVVAGIAFIATQSEDPAPLPSPEPAAVAVSEQTDAERMKTATAEAVAQALQDRAVPGRVMIHSAPTGAICTSASGEQLGTTPLSISGEKIMAAGSVVLKLKGHRDGETDALVIPPDNTTTQVKIALVALPHVTFASTPADANVRLEGESTVLGTTPFDWTMPEALADRLGEDKTVRFTFEKPGLRATTHTLTKAQLKDGRAVVAMALRPVVRRATGPSPSSRSKSSASKPKPKPVASKPRPKPKPKPKFTF